MATDELLMDESPLPVLYDEARKLYEDEAGNQSNSAQANRRCLLLLNESSRNVRAMALFSPNEELDDVSTADLKYLVIPYMQADVLHRSPVLERDDGSSSSAGNEEEGSRTPFSAPSPDELASIRLQSLAASERHLAEFLDSCDRLQLVDRAERATLTGELGPSGSQAPQGLDPAAKRAVKVARFKKEKEVKRELQEVKARRAAAQRMRIRASANGNVENEDPDTENTEGAALGAVDAKSGSLEGLLSDDFEDEAQERELWLLDLMMCWVKALELQDVIKKEVDMLKVARLASRQQGPDAFVKPLTREELDRNLADREVSHRRAAQAAAFERRNGNAAPRNVITCATLAQDVLEGRAGQEHVASHRHTPMPMAGFGPGSLIGRATGRDGIVDSGNLGQLSTLGTRQAAALRVFQPSHNLPTMSIEEAGLREMQMMEDWKESARKEMEEQGLFVKESGGSTGPAGGVPGEEGKREEEEEEEEEKEETDEDVMRARRWDDWKDTHRTGAGNSKLKPTG